MLLLEKIIDIILGSIGIPILFYVFVSDSSPGAFALFVLWFLVFIGWHRASDLPKRQKFEKRMKAEKKAEKERAKLDARRLSEEREEREYQEYKKRHW